MSLKRPSFQFYPGDWMKDPSLSMCSATTRGIWMDLLCAIHEVGHGGRVTGTATQLSRLCRCTVAEMEAALDELSTTRTATISKRHDTVSVHSKRMERDLEIRLIRATSGAQGGRGNEKQNESKPKAKRKQNTKQNGGSSSSSSFSSSSSTSVEDKEPPDPQGGSGEDDPPDKPAPIDPLKVDFPPSLDSPEFRAAWADWMQHRSEIRKPYRPLGVQKLVGQLAAMGASRAIAAINWSIANQYQGIYESNQRVSGVGRVDDPRGNIAVVEEYLRGKRS